MNTDQSWEQGKRRHLELSRIAAPIYDEIYEQANFATASYMNYEVQQLRDLMRSAPDRSIAVDLGCGTGRHSFDLARHFDQVYGVDFSPEMIEQAEKSKVKLGHGNVSFEVADVEEGLPSQVGAGTASLVTCSFGMGSFVKHLPELFKTVRMLLKARGVAAFSWYNRDALVNNLNLEWTPALAARVVPESDLLRVNFDGRDRDISAIAYSAVEIRHQLVEYFDKYEVTTYPTLTALFPHTLLQDKKAQELCMKVDNSLAHQVEDAAGPYIFATAVKGGRTDSKALLGYALVMDRLRKHGINPKTLEHPPVRTMHDVQQQLPAIDPAVMIKSVLVAKRRREVPDFNNDDLVLALVPATARLSFSKLAHYLEMPRSALYLATASQLEKRTGFSVGAIPPFGMPRRVQTLLDSKLAAKSEVWSGSGKTTETMILTINQLRTLSNCSTADISTDLRQEDQ